MAGLAELPPLAASGQDEIQFSELAPLPPDHAETR